mmetsp:Transcript_366/g.1282  ORF Transcript_366/g.1282 Transcript_366/m.1282 type:complete len:345 (+) Transcript_366:292-1326(+)
MAFSVAAFSMSMHPKSKFSAAHVCTAAVAAASMAASSGVAASSARRCLAMDTRSGSLHVTNASDPARFATMSCAALRARASSGSVAKSLATISLVVMHAMVTLRSTTGWMISRMARSTATGATRLKAAPWTPAAAETVMYEARFGMTVCVSPEYGAPNASARAAGAARGCICCGCCCACSPGRAASPDLGANACCAPIPCAPIPGCGPPRAICCCSDGGRGGGELGAACGGGGPNAPPPSDSDGAGRLTLKSGFRSFTGCSLLERPCAAPAMSSSLTPRCLHKTSISNLMFIFSSSTSYKSRSTPIRPINHGLGGRKTMLVLAPSRILATKGQMAINLPDSKPW